MLVLKKYMTIHPMSRQQSSKLDSLPPPAFAFNSPRKRAPTPPLLKVRQIFTITYQLISCNLINSCIVIGITTPEKRHLHLALAT